MLSQICRWVILPQASTAMDWRQTSKTRHRKRFSSNASSMSGRRVKQCREERVFEAAKMHQNAGLAWLKHGKTSKNLGFTGFLALTT